MTPGELGRRWAVAVAGMPVALVAAWLGGWMLGGVLALLAAVGTWEYYRLAAHTGVRAFLVPGVAASAGLVLIATGYPTLEAAAPRLWALLLALFLACSAAAVRLRGVDGRPMAAVAVTMAGALYTGGTLSFALFLRHFPAATAAGGFGLLLFPVLVTWSSDSAAFFVGRARGRRRLSPTVSPGKTIEGAAAGVVGGALAAGVLTSLVLRGWLGLPVGVGTGAAAGVVLALAGQIGDLAKSVLKREAGVKDSGTFFPGHGGVLDRLDALFFALPVAYGMLRLLAG